ncbi:MAG: hypothetical protein FJZ96_01915 [Chloroflexi bacterium]|nr:hypothetical protein [Chloroflexota bacterium]
MKAKLTAALLPAILLAACSWTPAPYQPPLATPQPSRTPLIVPPTPVVVFPSATVTATGTASGATGSPTPTETASPTPSPSPTFTPLPPLAVEVIGCNTSLDLRHQMGEVTNAYTRLRNYSAEGLTQVCATLEALDEDRVHPDKTVCIASLPSFHQVILKLTVDTQFQVDTSIQVDVVSGEGLAAFAFQESCREAGLFLGDPEQTGVVEPIP